MNIQGWYPLGLTGLISLLSQGLSRVFSSTTVRKHQLFGAQLSCLLYGPTLILTSNGPDLLVFCEWTVKSPLQIYAIIVCVCVCVFKEETVTEQEQIENEKKKQWMRGMKLPVEPQLHSFLVAATRAQIVIFCRTLYQKESVLLAKLSQLSQVGLRWSNLILIHDLQPARTYILKCFISSTTFLGLSTVSNS